MEDKKFNLKCLIRDIFYVSLGSVFLALALALFLIPNKIATGGVAGLSIVLHYVTDWPTGMLMLLLNIPMFFIGLKFLGKNFVLRSLYAMFSFSFFTDFFVQNLEMAALTDNLMLATLYGGLLVGVGLGLVFKGEASAGGGTIVARVISQKTRFTTGQVLFTTDFFVIISAAFVFKNIELALWGFITIYIASQVIDLILTGKPFAKVVNIITTKVDEIGVHIISDLGRSATIINAKGLYSQAQKNMLMVVVDSSQIYHLRDIVRLHDPEAFMVTLDAKEIMGKGF